MDYKLRVIDVETGKIVGSADGPNPYGAFEIGDEYVRQNPDKDYKVVDEVSGEYLRRSRFIDKDEEIRKFAESEVGGRF